MNIRTVYQLPTAQNMFLSPWVKEFEKGFVITWESEFNSAFSYSPSTTSQRKSHAEKVKIHPKWKVER